MLFLAKALLYDIIGMVLWTVQISCDDPEPWTLDDYVPLDTIPTHYQISVNPDVDTAKFNGSAVINVTVAKEKMYLWINYYDIEINKAVVSNISVKEIPIKKTFVYEENDYFVIQFENTITPGDYQLNFVFNGSVNNGDNPTEQIFSVIVDSHNIERRFMYSGNFFPVFDREAFKSTYDITIIAAFKTQEYRAMSNMVPEKIIPDSPQKGKTTTKFKTSPLMQIVAPFFAVLNYEKLPTAYTKEHVAVTLYARSAIIANCRRALETAVASLDFYANYLNASFPLPKVDVVVIPEGPNFNQISAFTAWGMVALTESYSIYAPGRTDGVHEFFTVASIAHEMSHSSFDIIASPAKYTENLLSEGTAEFMMYKVAKFLHPQWDETSFFMISNYYEDMENQAKLTALPVAVFNPDTANVFSISYASEYSKGAVVFRMLECAIGKDNMQRGIRYYRQKFAYNIAYTTDMWAVMQRYAPDGVNITRMMQSWTCQSGYPLLIVERHGDKLTISQTRFLLEKDAKYNRSDSPDHYMYEIPLTVVASNGFEIVQPVWFKLDKPTVTIQLPRGTTWYKLNKDECNYMRILYPLNDMKLLADILKYNRTALKPIERGDLIDSAFALAESEYIPFTVALDFTKYMHQEDALMPWFAFLEPHMIKIRIIVMFTAGYENFRKYYASKIKDLLDERIWIFSNDDTPDKRMLQSLLLEYACIFDIPKCTEHARNLFLQWIHCGIKLHADAKKTVLFSGIATTGAHEWYAVLNLYLNETVSAEKSLLLDTLCRTRERWLITHLLVTAEVNDLVDIISSCSAPSIANRAAWYFIRENWDYLSKHFSYELVTMISGLTRKYSTTIQLKEVEAFLADVSEDKIGKNDRDEILSKIKMNINFKQKYSVKVTDWFQKALM